MSELNTDKTENRVKIKVGNIVCRWNNERPESISPHRNYRLAKS